MSMFNLTILGKCRLLFFLNLLFILFQYVDLDKITFHFFFLLQMSDMKFFVAILSLAFMYVADARPDFTGLPLEPYCKIKGCCGGRIDECSAPIYGKYF